jgi:haloacetate dehalogenase
LPERLLEAAPDAVIDHAISGWGSPSSVFSAEVRAEYLHAICEEYRAAATLDRSHDDADRASGRRVGGPLPALWSGVGPLATWYDDAGGPLALWRTGGEDVRGHPVNGGHFFPEEMPEETADRLAQFSGQAR